ncbi:DUF3139 domain-containing protein [Rummeliibacillus pycnus]|uniref:DUF3139 domain-containing protein n=1 Tax=Rummeliibacillus pycnus TaxID=101070 RepID=UPI0037C8B4F0
MNKKLKYFLIFIISCIVIAGAIFGYMEYKKYAIKKDVETYLTETKKIDKKDITEITPYYSKETGDRFLLVYVTLKNDKKEYTYMRDSKTNKIKLESYNIGDKTY